MAEINNRDTEYNIKKFSNFRVDNKRDTGEVINVTEADGIDVISGMNFSCEYDSS